MEIFQAFGLNIKILLAQLINFALLLFILHRFAYKPILSFLEQRRKKIEDGVRKAEKVDEKVKLVRQKIEEKMGKAKKEALIILENSRKQADEEKKQIINKAKDEANFLKEKTRKQLELEKENLVTEAKKDIVNISLMLSSKILKRNLTSQDEDRLGRDVLEIIKTKEI